MIKNYETWAYPFFEAPRRIPRAERGRLFDAFVAGKAERARYFATRFPSIADALASLSAPDGDAVAAMHRIERWWRKDIATIRVRESGLAFLFEKLGLSGSYEDIFGRDDAASLRAIRKAPNAAATVLLSIIGDLTIVLGDALILRRPDFLWAIDDDAEDARLKMPAAGRVVVMKPHQGERVPICLDVYDGLTNSYDVPARDDYKTVEVQGIWNSSFAGWQVVNTVNGWADAIP